MVLLEQICPFYYFQKKLDAEQQYVWKIAPFTVKQYIHFFSRNVEGGKICVTVMGKLILWLGLVTILCVIGFSFEVNFFWIQKT